MTLAPRIRCLLVCLLICSVRSGAAELHKVVLPNGVRLILKPESSAELVAISICIHTETDRNAFDDATGELVARALFSSSLNRSREKLSAGISQVGGSIETLRTADHVNITCVGLAAQVREAVFLLCEVLKNSDFGALERVRNDLISEQRRDGSGIADGLDILRRELQARSDLTDLPFQRVTRAQVGAYFRSRYVPERTAVAVVGRFDVQSVQTAFRDSLADFDRPGIRPIQSGPLYSHATNYPTRTLNRPGGSAYALVATPAPPLTDRDYPAFIILKSVLGEGHASRLFQRLRDAKGIGYNVGAVWQTGLSDPLIAFLQWEASPPSSTLNAPAHSMKESAKIQKPGNDLESPLTPQYALRLLNLQIDSLVTDPPSIAEVGRARNVAIGRELLRHERARDRAFLLAWYEAMGVGAAFDAELPGRLAAVTRDDVMRVARNYLSPCVSVLLAPNR